MPAKLDQPLRRSKRPDPALAGPVGAGVVRAGVGD